MVYQGKISGLVCQHRNTDSFRQILQLKELNSQLRVPVGHLFQCRNKRQAQNNAFVLQIKSLAMSSPELIHIAESDLGGCHCCTVGLKQGVGEGLVMPFKGQKYYFIRVERAVRPPGWLLQEKQPSGSGAALK